MTERKPLALLLLPFRFFADPTSKHFLEWGVSAAILLLYVPILFLVAQLFLRHRWRLPHGLIYLSIAVVYLVSPWVFSSLGRYSLHWYPTFAAWLGVMISHVCARAEAAWNSRLAIGVTRIATAIFCCVLIYPTPTEDCIRFYRNYYLGTTPLLRPRHDLQVSLEKDVTGYLATKAVIGALAFNQKTSTRVLASPGVDLPFYFRKAKITSVGDYFGPARYSDLFAEIEQGNCLSYLSRFDISAVIVDLKTPRNWPLTYKKFLAQLKEYHFIEYRCGGDQVRIFLRSDIKPTRKLNQVAQ
jgi:hypothetical protein